MLYGTCKSENVRFSRLVMMLLTLSYALFSVIESMYGVLALTVFALVFGINNGITSLVLVVLKKLGIKKAFEVDPRHKRSFAITRTMEVFEELMRLSLTIIVIYLHMNELIIASTTIAFIMSMFMIISTFFGFCMSGILYVIFQRFFGKKHGIK